MKLLAMILLSLGTFSYAGADCVEQFDRERQALNEDRYWKDQVKKTIESLSGKQDSQGRPGRAVDKLSIFRDDVEHLRGLKFSGWMMESKSCEKDGAIDFNISKLPNGQTVSQIRIANKSGRQIIINSDLCSPKEFLAQVAASVPDALTANCGGGSDSDEKAANRTAKSREILKSGEASVSASGKSTNRTR